MQAFQAGAHFTLAANMLTGACPNLGSGTGGLPKARAYTKGPAKPGLWSATAVAAYFELACTLAKAPSIGRNASLARLV
jgi:hypothetical protein